MLWRANGHRSLDSKRNGSSRGSVNRMLNLNWNRYVMDRDGQHGFATSLTAGFDGMF